MFEDAPQKTPPPYVSFKTFSNFIEGLRGTEHLPSHIDRTVMSSLSGSAQSQLLQALRFFGFVDGNLAPTKKLESYVRASTETQNSVFAELIQAAYSEIWDGVELERTTSAVLNKRLGEAGLGGSTVGKALAFYVAAAKQAGLVVSQHVKVTRTKPASSRKPVAKKRVEKSAGNEEAAHHPATKAETKLHHYPIPMPQFGVTAAVDLPADLDKAGWEMMNTVITAYAEALVAKNTAKSTRASANEDEANKSDSTHE